MTAFPWGGGIGGERCILPLPYTSWVALCKSLASLRLSFLICKMGVIGLLWRISQIDLSKQCLLHNTKSEEFKESFQAWVYSYLAEHLLEELISKEPFTCLKNGARKPGESYRRTENISVCNIIARMAFAKHQFLKYFLWIPAFCLS